MTVEEYCKLANVSRGHYDKCPECTDRRLKIIKHTKTKIDEAMYPVRLQKAKEKLSA